MRRKALYLLAALVLCVSWASAEPKVPLAGVEASRLTESAGTVTTTTAAGYTIGIVCPQGYHIGPGGLCFGDGPTPMPPDGDGEHWQSHPNDPTLREYNGLIPVEGLIPAETLLDKHAEGVTLWVYRGTQLVWIDCLDRAQEKLAGEPEAIRTIVMAMQKNMSADIVRAYGPWKDALRAEVRAVNRERLRANPPLGLLPIETVNELWQARVRIHASEILVSIAGMPATDGGTCAPHDTGRCDCKICDPGNVCGCLYYREGMSDCDDRMRDNCNFEYDPTPDELFPTVNLRF